MALQPNLCALALAHRLHELRLAANPLVLSISNTHGHLHPAQEEAACWLEKFITAYEANMVHSGMLSSSSELSLLYDQP